MKHENENAANLYSGLRSREFMAMLAVCTAGLMVHSLSHGEGKVAAAAASRSDRLGRLLPLRRLGSSGPVVTNLGVGGAHVGSAPEKDAQAIIRKSLGRRGALLRQRPLLQRWKSREALWKIPHSQAFYPVLFWG